MGIYAILRREMDKTELNTELVALLPQMDHALKNTNIPSEKVARIVLTEATKNPKILGCTRESILTSVMEACQLGLEPNAISGLGYLIPYGNKCQFIPGYKGYIKLALQSGSVSSIWARVVKENDLFEYEEGDNPFIRHKPCIDGGAGKAIAVYAIAKKTNGDKQFEVMSFADVEDIRKKSSSGKFGPWKDDWNQMAKKTAVKQLCKYLELDSDKASIAAEKQEGGMSGMVYDLDKKDFVYVNGGEDKLNGKMSDVMSDDPVDLNERFPEAN